MSLLLLWQNTLIKVISVRKDLFWVVEETKQHVLETAGQITSTNQSIVMTKYCCTCSPSLLPSSTSFHLFRTKIQARGWHHSEWVGLHSLIYQVFHHRHAQGPMPTFHQVLNTSHHNDGLDRSLGHFFILAWLTSVHGMEREGTKGKHKTSSCS